MKGIKETHPSLAELDMDYPIGDYIDHIQKYTVDTSDLFKVITSLRATMGKNEPNRYTRGYLDALQTIAEQVGLN